jgi:CelD/BcsL family acetyltransferase involved in cellulose biosynthesis
MRLHWMDRRDIGAIEPVWRSVTERARSSYFQSWSWVGHWLRSLPPRHDVQLAVISDDRGPVGAFFVGSALEWRNGFVVSQAKYVNETGDPAIDDLCLEYNSFVCADDARLDLRRLLDEIPGAWDELYMSALDAERFPGDALASLNGRYRVEVRSRVPSCFVDLDAVRARGDYVSLLGQKTRAHLRRTYRAFQAEGPVSTEAASDLSSALSIYGELVELHQRHWNARGFPGAFSRPYFRNFHQRLVRERHASGEIQLLRVRVADRTVGCIYGFVHEGVLHHYQTGLAYDGDTRERRPGFLCNAEAITYCAKSGLKEYDFLGGGEPYKKMLSTGERSLVSIRVQKPRVRFWLERGFKSVRDAWRARRAAPPGV